MQAFAQFFVHFMFWDWYKFLSESAQNVKIYYVQKTIMYKKTGLPQFIQIPIIKIDKNESQKLAFMVFATQFLSYF